MSKKGTLILFLIISTVVILLLCCFCFAMYSLISSSNLSAEDTSLPRGAKEQTVAIIDIDGIITETSTADLWGNETLDMVSSTIEKLERAKNDENVKAVLLRIDSPGGEVYPTRKIYNKINELIEQEKVVVVLMEGTAASGGYYISTPADWIVASDMTMTGSIGVIFTTLDLSGLYEKIGVEEISIVNTEGDLKVVEDLNDENGEGYKVYQGLADDMYNNFVQVIMDGRGMTREQVVEIADGRVYSGAQALNNRLIDQLGEQKEAIAKIEELANLDDPNFEIYKDKSTYGSLYGYSLLELFKPEYSLLKDGVEAEVKAYYLMK